MDKDKVFVDANDIINWIPGYPTGDEQGTMLSIDVMKQLLEERGPMNILVDLSRAKRPDAKQREIIINAVRSYFSKIKKVAIFGETPLMKAIAYFIINASEYKNLKFFDSRSRAEAWLTQTD